MKSLKEVKKYLTEVGVNEEDIKAVYGFLYAEGEMPIEEKLEFKPTNKTWMDFVNWYEDEECGDDEMDGGVFNNEVKAELNDDLLATRDKVIVGWGLIKDIANSIEYENLESIEFDCVKNLRALAHANLCMDVLVKSVTKIHELLKVICNKEKEDNEEEKE